jgi:hypothetical protein
VVAEAVLVIPQPVTPEGVAVLEAVMVLLVLMVLVVQEVLLGLRAVMVLGEALIQMDMAEVAVLAAAGEQLLAYS